jgi:hypothetical protein
MKTRTTVTAEAEDLDTLRAEATRRGISLNEVLAEAVTQKAGEIRRRRRPRVGLGRSQDGRSAAEVTSDPVAEPFR